MSTNVNMESLVEMPSLRWEVTPRHLKKLPIYNWFVFPHSYSPNLVSFLFRRYGIRPGQFLLDPFVGAGTSLLAAKQEGISGLGLDVMPLSVVLSRAKTAEYDTRRLSRLVDVLARLLLSDGANPAQHDSHIKHIAARPNNILARAFSANTLDDICAVRFAIDTIECTQVERDFMLVALLHLLERHSKTQKSGGWLKIIASPKSTESFRTAFVSRARQMILEIEGFQHAHGSPRGTWTAMQADARDMDLSGRQVDTIISSPPYLNRHDYSRVMMLELLVGFLSNYDELFKLRDTLLRSHVEAKPAQDPQDYARPHFLLDCLSEMESQQAEPRIVRMVEAYFIDMHCVLKTMKQSLSPGGVISFVLGNVRFNGVPIPVDLIVAEIGKAVGLQFEEILVARRRNNSAQQMRDYGREPSRECVITWRAE